MARETRALSITIPPLAHMPQTDSTHGTRVSNLAVQLASPVFNKETKDPITPLPPKKQSLLIRKVRHTYGAVYQRLFLFVFLCNMVAFIILISKVDLNSHQMLSNLATASAANIMVAVAMRQQFVINAIFKTCWLIPKSAPLRIRRMAAKCYEFGGMHSGAAVSSTVWFIIFTTILMKKASEDENKAQYAPVLSLAWILLLLLVAICSFAVPQFRMVSHNTFEFIHRFAGWSSLALFWVELILFAAFTSEGQSSLGPLLVRQPAFWFLIVTTCFIIWPWLLLRKLTIRAEYLSERAVRLHFTGYKVPPFSGIALSTSPLLEWHSFACMAAPPNGGSVLISNGGDWTRGGIILQARLKSGLIDLDTVYSPKPYYWVRGIPATGVLNMAQVFDKVVILTTGSGIGPVLSYLIGDKRKGKCRLIWSGKFVSSCSTSSSSSHQYSSGSNEHIREGDH